MTVWNEHVVIFDLLFRSRSVPPVIRLIEANIAVDGLPMHNSGPTQLWPILMHIVNLPALPIMVLGVFCGATKPSCLEGFLRPLVDDINRVLVQGIDVNGIIIDFRLKAIVADTPARAFIKGKNDTIRNLRIFKEK